MDVASPLMLARAQFAANMSFHILFPAISIALSWLLLFFKACFDRTRDPKWTAAYRLWVKVFALTFALGVVSGVTMSFQFGTNWPGFMLTVGNIAGPLLAYEVLTAFFLEAAFLGIMLYGTRLVSNRVHTLATVLVALGTTLSAFWILALNSWMHTPVGFEMRDGKAHATDWLAILTSPSMPYRFTHMLLASALTVAFMIAGVSAYRWLRGDRGAEVRATLATGIYVAALLIPVQILVGDMHGLNTLEHQPAKIAAIEAVWHTERSAPLTLFAWPNEAAGRNDFAITVPGAASLILTHHADGEVRGLSDFPGTHPPVAPLFWGFRIMVGLGFAMLAIAWTAAWQWRRRGQIADWLARVLAGSSFIGWAAVLAGWYVTEIGRQPWLVYGVLRVADAASDKTSADIGSSFVLYLIAYAVLLPSFIAVVFHLARRASQVPA
jgi:cytochrome bd ubiquinol oxidase subunit I